MYTTLIDVEQLASQRQDPNWVIIDCRFSLANTDQGAQHYAQSRISGARYAHLDHDLSSPIVSGKTGRHPLPDHQTLAQKFTDWGIHNHSQVVVYDDKNGAIAGRFWWLCKWLGLESCAVLNGGFAAWVNQGQPLDTGPASPQTPSQGTFNPAKPLVSVVEKHAVLSPAHHLLDAREPERYRGEVEPVDPIAGHIAGAYNMPFADNCQADGFFKPVSELRARFQAAQQQAGQRTLVHYCGSGVTAAHNILAMTHAGLPPGSLYAGSFSEWITTPCDERYPVARLER